MSYTIDEALGYRTRIIDAVQSAQDAINAGTELVSSLRAEIEELTGAIRNLPNVPVSDLGMAVEHIAERVEHLLNGNLENVTHHATRLERHMTLIVGELPCEQGVREFAGDSNHDNCYNAEDVRLTVHDGPNEWRDNRMISYSHLEEWIDAIIEKPRVVELLEEASAQLERETFDVRDISFY